MPTAFVSPRPLWWLFCLCIAAAAPPAAAQLLPYKADGRWGLKDAQGRSVVPAQYELMDDFGVWGYAKVQKAGRCGLIDSSGQEVLPTRYDDARPIGPGIFVVRAQGKAQLINAQGQPLLTGDFEAAQWVGGRAVFYRKPSGWGALDAQGRELCPPVYERLDMLSPSFIRTQQQGRYGLYGPDGKLLLHALCSDIRIVGSDVALYKKDDFWAAKNAAGEQLLLEWRYQDYAPYTDRYLKLWGNGYCYLFDLEKRRIPFSGPFQDIFEMQHPAHFRVWQDGALGVADASGAILVPPLYQEINDFSPYFFRARQGQQWYLLDTRGINKPDRSYDYIGPLEGSHARSFSQGRYGLISQRGNEVLPTAYEAIDILPEQIRAFKADSVLFFMPLPDGQLRFLGGNPLRRVGLSKAPRQQQAHAIARNEWVFDAAEKRWGLRDPLTGDYLIPPRYDEIAVDTALQLTVVFSYGNGATLRYGNKHLRFRRLCGLVDHLSGQELAPADMLHVYLDDFASGLPCARAIDEAGQYRLLHRRDGVLTKGFAYVGAFHSGVARSNHQGIMVARLPAGPGGDDLAVARAEAHFAEFLCQPVWGELPQGERDFWAEALLFVEAHPRPTRPHGNYWFYLDTIARLSSLPDLALNHLEDCIGGRGKALRQGKWGLVSAKGDIILDFRYDAVRPFGTSGHFITSLGHWRSGIMDLGGHYLVPPLYEDIRPAAEGHFAAKSEGKWGFINQRGEAITPFHFLEVGDFSEGLAAVKVSNHKGWGYIDTRGRERIAPRFTWAGQFSEGKAYVKEGGQYGYIGPSGDYLIPRRYERNASDFRHGLALVESQGQQIVIDAQGRHLRSYDLGKDRLGPFDAQGRAVLRRREKQNTYYYLLDTELNVLGGKKYRAIMPFSEGFAAVKDDSNRFGYINAAGEELIPPQFQQVSNFSEGKAWVVSDHACGYIDTTGAFRIAPAYEECAAFKGGTTHVRQKGQHHVLTHDNKQLTTYQQRIKTQQGGTVVLEMADGQEAVSIADDHFFDNYYQLAELLNDSLVLVQQNGLWGISNSRGLAIQDARFAALRAVDGQYLIFTLDHSEGLCDAEGQPLLPSAYERIAPAAHGLLRVEAGGRIGYANAEGHFVIPMGE